MGPKKFLAALSICSSLVACATSSQKNQPLHRKMASELDVSCIGPETANTFAIYLHGMDFVVPSAQEIENRVILAKLATEKNIRFALPRAQMKCPSQPKEICWGWKFDHDELEAILPRIMKARTACFGDTQPFKILGFSNGGYLLTHWYLAGTNTAPVQQPSSVITSGSAKGEIATRLTTLYGNPPLTLINGDEDSLNFDSSEELFHQLQNLKAPVKLIEFHGQHSLDQTSLRTALDN